VSAARTLIGIAAVTGAVLLWLLVVDGGSDAERHGVRPMPVPRPPVPAPEALVQRVTPSPVSGPELKKQVDDPAAGAARRHEVETGLDAYLRATASDDKTARLDARTRLLGDGLDAERRKALIDAIRKRLDRGGDERTLRALYELLAQLGDKDAVHEMLRRAQDAPAPGKRKLAEDGLRQVKNRASEPLLLDAFGRDVVRTTRLAVAEALRNMESKGGADALFRHVDATDDADAARILGGFRGAGPQLVLLDQLVSEPDEAAGEPAATAVLASLRQGADKEVVYDLVRRLRLLPQDGKVPGKDHALVRALQAAGGDHVFPLLSALVLEEPSPIARAVLLDELVRRSPAKAHPTLLLLGRPDEDPRVLERIKRYLGIAAKDQFVK
jgi:hypothetical protein